MKFTKHIRGKSDTDFHIDKQCLDTIHSNLNLFKDTIKISSPKKKKKVNFNTRYEKFINNFKPFVSNFFSEENDNFNNILVRTLLFKKDFEKGIFKHLMSFNKDYINNIFILLKFIIKNFKIKIIKKLHEDDLNNEFFDIQNELLEKITKFENIINIIIETEIFDYSREIKKVIINEFEKCRYEIEKFLDDEKNTNFFNSHIFLSERDEISTFIINISQIMLFELSTMFYQLDYFTIAMNCLLHKIKHNMINLIDKNKKFDGKNIEIFKSFHIIDHIINLSKNFSENFYNEEDNLNLNIFASNGRYIFKNLIEICSKCNNFSIPNDKLIL